MQEPAREPEPAAEADVPQFLYDRGFVGILAAAASALRADILLGLEYVGLPAWGPGRVGLISRLLDQPMSQVEIARYLNISAPSAMQLVKRLVRDGYVQRARDPKDHRRMVVRLTPTAREQVIAMRRTLVSGMERIEAALAAQGFTQEDMEGCKALLKAYAQVDRAVLPQRPEVGRRDAAGGKPTA